MAEVTLPQELRFPDDPLLNLLLFEYQEFLHQPLSLSKFDSLKQEDAEEADDEMRGGGDESKYAAVFNQVCSSVKEEITTLQAETDTIYNEIEQLTAEQERIIADTPDRE